MAIMKQLWDNSEFADLNIRDYSSFNASRFLSELQEIKWRNSSDNDANKSFTTFYKKMLGKEACPNEISLQARGKNIVKTMDYQRY